MLDPKLLRGQLDETAQRLAARGYRLDTARIAALEMERKEVQMRTQALQNERNTRSKAFGKAKAAGEDIAPLMTEVAQLGEQLGLLDFETKTKNNKTHKTEKHKPLARLHRALIQFMLDLLTSAHGYT